MSHKPKNRNKKYQPKPRVSQANQLEELLGACNDGLNVARASLHNLISRYKSNPNRTKANAQQTAVIDDYIKSAYNDITALDESLATTSKKAREVAKNYPNPEDSIIANIEISQEFYDYLLANGIKAEAARRFIPQAAYTELWAGFNNFQLDNFLELRLESHSQKEIRFLAEAMRDLWQENSIEEKRRVSRVVAQ